MPSLRRLSGAEIVAILGRFRLHGPLPARQSRQAPSGPSRRHNSDAHRACPSRAGHRHLPRDPAPSVAIHSRGTSPDALVRGLITDGLGRSSSYCRDRDPAFRSVISWRRARDSNPQGACAPVDFKSTALPVEASPPGLRRSQLTIHPRRQHSAAPTYARYPGYRIRRSHGQLLSTSSRSRRTVGTPREYSSGSTGTMFPSTR